MYIVFARKWRPKSFEEIIGQEHITTTLTNAIKQNRVAHAYLFCGPRGIGKTTTARIFARALNCEKGPAVSPCDKCIPCKQILEGASLDIIEIDGASNRGVEEIRNLRENVKFSPQSSRFKIYIIDEVHMLTPEAFNALLKTLEEPPAHIKFIFCTTAAYKMPATILSRCQRFNFKRLGIQQIIDKIRSIAKEEKIKIEDGALFTIARAASGSMRDAESLLDQLATYCSSNITTEDTNNVLGCVEQEALYDFIKYIVSKDTAGALKLINKIVDEGIDPNQFLTSLIEAFRNAMIIKSGKGMEALVELSKDETERIAKVAEPLTVEDSLYILYALINTISLMRRSPSPKIPLELMAVKLSQKENIVSLDEIVKRLAALESGAGQRASKASGLAARQASEVLSETPSSSRGEVEGKTEDRGQRPEVRGQAVDYSADASDIDPSMYKIKDAFSQAIKNIRQEKIYIASCLEEGKLVGFKNNILTIGFHKKNTFHKESLEKPQNKKLIEEQLSSLLGSNTVVEFITLRDSDGQGDNREDPHSSAEEKNPIKKVLSDPIIKTALNIFDGNIMKFI